MGKLGPGSSRPRQARVGVLLIGVIIVLGVFVGIGTFTFGYAHGLSYLSSDPQACANCHIMDQYYESWQHSGHHHVTVCVDCHLPHDPVRKYVAKADNGFFHSLAFTLDNFHEPIQIKARNRRITQENCIACHRDTVHQMLPAAPETETLMCIHCHAGVGHGPR